MLGETRSFNARRWLLAALSSLNPRQVLVPEVGTSIFFRILQMRRLSLRWAGDPSATAHCGTGLEYEPGGGRWGLQGLCSLPCHTRPDGALCT